MTLGALPAAIDDRLPGGAPAAGSVEHGHGDSQRIVRRLPSGDGFLIRYDDATTFVVDGRGHRIWASWPDTLTLEDTAVYLLGPVLAFSLRLRGVTCLHASAVSSDRGAIALVGPSGAGKSTAAAALGGRGHAIASDDLLALETRADTILAHSGCPRLRLWPDSVALLFGTRGALPRLTPNWDKRYLNLLDGGYRYEPRSLPLAAVYLLDARRGRGHSARIERLRASEGLLCLLANTRTEGLTDRRSQRRDFDTMGRIARHVPLRRVHVGSGSGSISALCDAIDSDLDAMWQACVPQSEIACTI